MKKKAVNMDVLIKQNKAEILSNKKEIERIELKLEEKHNKRLKINN